MRFETLVWSIQKITKEKRVKKWGKEKTYKGTFFLFWNLSEHYSFHKIIFPEIINPRNTKLTSGKTSNNPIFVK